MDGDQEQGGYQAYGWGDYGTSQDETATDRQSPYAITEDVDYYGASYAAGDGSNPYAYVYDLPEDNAYNDLPELHNDEPNLEAEPVNDSEPQDCQPADTYENGVPRRENPDNDNLQPQEVLEPADSNELPAEQPDEMFGFGAGPMDGTTETSNAIEPNDAFGFFGFDDAPLPSATTNETLASDLAIFSGMPPVLPLSDNDVSFAPACVSRVPTPSDSAPTSTSPRTAFAQEPEAIYSAQAEDSAALLEHLRRVRKMLVIDQILRLRAAIGADRVFRDMQPQQMVPVESREEISVALPCDESLHQVLSEEPQSSQEVGPLRSFSNADEYVSEDVASRLQTDPETERSIREVEAIIEDALVRTPEIKDLESLPDIEAGPLSDAPEDLETATTTAQSLEHISNKTGSDSFERIQDSDLIDELKSEISQWGQPALEEHSYASSVHRQATPCDSTPDEFVPADSHGPVRLIMPSEDLIVDRVTTPDVLDDSFGLSKSSNVCHEESYIERQAPIHEQEYKPEPEEILQPPEEKLDEFDIEMARKEAEMLEQARREEEEMLRRAEEDLYNQEEEPQELEEKMDHVPLSTGQETQEDSLLVSRLESPAISFVVDDDDLCVDRLNTPVVEPHTLPKHPSKPHAKHKAERQKDEHVKEKHYAVKQKKEQKSEKADKAERVDKTEKQPKHEADKKKTNTIKKKPDLVEETKDASAEKPQKVSGETSSSKSRSAIKSATETRHTDKKLAKKQQKEKKAPVEQESSTTISSLTESSHSEDIAAAEKMREEQLRKIEEQKRRQEEKELRRLLAEEKLRMDKEIERANRRADREYQKLEAERKRFAVNSQIESNSATSSAIDMTNSNLLSDRELMRELRLRERRDKELQALRHNIEAQIERESNSVEYDPSVQALSAVRRSGYGTTSSILRSNKHKDSGRHVSLFVDTSSYSSFYVKVLSHRTVIISGSRPFVSYYIEFGMDGRRLHISCRFSEVKELHAAISAAYPAATLPDIPPDRPYALGGWKPEFIREREKLLEAYLYSMHSITFVRTSNIYRQFLKAARC
ncbi:Hypothetical protein GLP15_433 [Giardia lamblia P15]|uniref:PX domain-containing protein n=1 Tax=Giardia intestinalis (strain P15) TaxID=658858 RepID=E1F070_GIAIA|nr:Hypothetical protein GLP15_433 [Giardia lamblia P15]